jgi:hypothetical protein
MYELRFNTLRSRVLSGSELTNAMEQLAAQSSRDDFEQFATSDAHSCPFRLWSLPALDAFQSISPIFGVTVITEDNQADAGQRFSSFTRRTHDLSLNHDWTTWYVGESDPALEATGNRDLSISAGLRKEGYFTGVYVHRPSPAADDLLRRAALLQRVVSEVGLIDWIKVSMDGDVLRLKALEPWRLTYPSSRPDGGNPLGFYACGFPDINQALTAGERLVECLARKTFGVSFVAKLTGEGYDTVFRELNELWHPWEIEVMGSLSPKAIAVLRGGEVGSESPSRVPAFTWYCERNWTAYGSVVIEHAQRFLEIAADGGTLEQLQKRVAILTDLHFDPVNQ